MISAIPPPFEKASLLRNTAAEQQRLQWEIAPLLIRPVGRPPKRPVILYDDFWVLRVGTMHGGCGPGGVA